MAALAKALWRDEGLPALPGRFPLLAGVIIGVCTAAGEGGPVGVIGGPVCVTIGVAGVSSATVGTPISGTMGMTLGVASGCSVGVSLGAESVDCRFETFTLAVVQVMVSELLGHQ